MYTQCYLSTLPIWILILCSTYIIIIYFRKRHYISDITKLLLLLLLIEKLVHYKFQVSDPDIQLGGGNLICSQYLMFISSLDWGPKSIAKPRWRGMIGFSPLDLPLQLSIKNDVFVNTCLADHTCTLVQTSQIKEDLQTQWNTIKKLKHKDKIRCSKSYYAIGNVTNVSLWT